MTQDANSAEIFVEGVIGASRSRVWQAFTDPALLQQWYAPTGWTLDTASTSVELKVGGAYRVSMHKESDPAIATSVLARFFDVIPEERLASHETVFGASGLEPGGDDTHHRSRGRTGRHRGEHSPGALPLRRGLTRPQRLGCRSRAAAGAARQRLID